MKVRKNVKIAFVIATLSIIVLLILFSLKDLINPVSTYIFYLAIYFIILSVVLSSRKNMHWIKNKKNLQNLILFLTTFLLVVLIIELTSFTLILLDEYPEYILARFSKEENFPHKTIYRYDKNIGYIGIPNSTFNHIEKNRDSSLLFNVTYSLDEYGRRMTPDIMSNSSVVLFGGSYAFGHGLNDNETLGYYLSKETNKKVYMYAYQGQGPNQMLAQLQRSDFEDELLIPPEVGLYLYIPHHINRVIGDMEIYTQWGYDMPYYYLKNNELERGGSFTSGRKLISSSYKFIGKSLFVKYNNLNIPTKIKYKHKYLTAKVIKESEELFESTFNGEFYVVIMPGVYDGYSNQDLEFIEILNDQNVNIIIYEFEFYPEIHTIKDGHPTERFNREFSKTVKEKIIT